ncbi:DNA repair protein [Rhizobium leguminosarum bv. trifolii]|uniref:DUF488 domain-containing protein n=1 Tax=Rhizobium leguminosarum TaxID=384 RepID=UPI000E2E48F9|nr:DUF488 domain-containing protein [Rhizobium leguminosarum]RFB97314.1 DNA repair protein [Rhizobium leguminosarum bv. trifolii]
MSGLIGNALPVFTIGHSTRSIAEFAELLRAGDVRLVADVRRVPRSATNPQYNAHALADGLAPYQIDYIRIDGLGGLRKKSPVPDEVNGFWKNGSFHNYADYALSAEFQTAFHQLLAASAERRTAIMCAEAVWWRCHRRIIADYLINAGRQVYHLMGTNEMTPATMTEGAVGEGDGLRYPGSPSVL